MKFVIICGITFILAGCGTRQEVPQQAVNACITAGGKPYFFSNGGFTIFSCDPILAFKKND